MAKTFLKQKGNYRNLIAFQKAECIYDVTYYFAHKFLSKGDRTIDQMVQAARSGGRILPKDVRRAPHPPSLKSSCSM